MKAEFSVKAVSRDEGKGKEKAPPGAWALGGIVALALLGWLATPVPFSASGMVEKASAAEDSAEEPAFEREVFVVYSVNNLGYIDTCG